MTTQDITQIFGETPAGRKVEIVCLTGARHRLGIFEKHPGGISVTLGSGSEKRTACQFDGKWWIDPPAFMDAEMPAQIECVTVLPENS